MAWVPRHQKSDPARRVAFNVIRAVHEDDAYANLALPPAIDRAWLNKRDAAFATSLTYGTLRLEGRMDAIIARASADRSIDQIDAPVLDLLRLGVYQLVELGTPPHAAINETVALTRNELGQGTAGFVNAVLRRVSERGNWEEILRRSAASEAQFLSAWYSHPRWIVDAYARTLEACGRENAVEPILEANNSPAKVALVPRGLTPEALRDRVERAKMTADAPALVPSAVLLDSGNPARLWPVQDGTAGVEDEGSQLIARMFVAASITDESGRPLEGTAGDSRWLDMCAGPGGKTATIAAVAAQRGATVFANEPQPHRLDLVEDAVAPWTDNVVFREGDGREIGAEEPNAYDRVLVDAPCSGLGALRRRPEARWRKDPTDLAELAALQGELLDSAYRAVRPGGLLYYTTCTPTLEETRDVISAFLERTPGASLGDARAEADTITLHPVGGWDKTVQLWPDTDGSDAMFIARILKAA